MRTCLATGDPDWDIPPVFTRACLVQSPCGRGNGFFLFERGCVVTAAHVVCQTDDRRAQLQSQVSISWAFTGKTYLFTVPIVVASHNRQCDIAILRLDDPEVLPRPLPDDSVTMLSSSPAMLGDRIFLEAFEPTETGGFIFRRLEGRVTNSVAVTSGFLEQRILLADVGVWPGASGAPIFSKTGQVVGLVSGSMRSTHETTIRDSRWILPLAKMAYGLGAATPPRSVIPFPGPLRRGYVTRVKPEVWSQRLRRFAGRVLRQAGGPA